MRHILVANAKGGCGKTTLATNLAGYFANAGQQVYLSDLDRQQSSTHWLMRRPEGMPTIHAMPNKAKSNLEADWVVTDSPAGLRDEKLEEAVRAADCILVPIQPSAFDIGAAQEFIAVLQQEKAVRKHKTFVALVGSRVNSRTHSAIALAHFMEQSGFPVLAYLRSAQTYVTAAELGLSLFDMRPNLVAQDLEQWSALLAWVDAIQESKR